MRILVLGKNGMLGQDVLKSFEYEKEAEVTAFGRAELDVTNRDAVMFTIQKIRPDVVMNAAGYTKVDDAEQEREMAFKVNAYGVENIADACKQNKCVLFHFSTDYVFNGKNRRGYREKSKEYIGPLNVYGESKLEGERRILALNLQKYFIVRTSWLYGSGGKNFVDTMLSLVQKGTKKLTIVKDQFGKPTYTKDLAEKVKWMAYKIDELESGIYHVTNETIDKKGVSWYVFAQEIFTQGVKAGIVKSLPYIAPCATDEFPRPASRPRFSALANTKLSQLRHWNNALAEYLQTKNA